MINFLVKKVILLLIYFAFAEFICAQDDVIKIDTDLVTVPVSILDRDGRYITNLKKEDFQIFEDGVEQEIAVFEPIEQPFTVLLLLDVSGSMFSDLGSLTNAASTFLGQLRPNDQVMAAAFNERVDVLFDFKSVKDLQNEKKSRIKIDGRPPVTMIYDAVEFGLKKMKKIRGRKAIILFSDGVGSGYTATAKSNLRDAEEGDSLIYTVQFNTYPSTPPRFVDKRLYYEKIEVAKNYMRDLAQVTGGRNYQIEKIADLEKTFRAIADELRQQYNLGYYPKQTGKAGERRQIKVRVNLPNAAVRARSSYVIGQKK